MNSNEGKALIKEITDRKKNAKNMIVDRENAVNDIFDELESFDIVTKIQIRQMLNKLGAFTVENLKNISNQLSESGVIVK